MLLVEKNENERKLKLPSSFFIIIFVKMALKYYLHYFIRKLIKAISFFFTNCEIKLAF